MGSRRECIIRERNALNPASATIRSVLSAQMSCRVSRIQQTLAVLGRRLRRLCLVSN